MNVPYKNVEKRRKYQREYMKRKRASGDYETPYQQWKREQLAKNASADVSFEAYLAHIEEMKLIKERYKRADVAWNPQKQQKPLEGCNPWHGEPSTRLLCSSCGMPMEKGDSPNPKLCGSCYIEENN